MDAVPGVNTSFSTQLPTLQLVIDSTSLGEFKLCARRYFYRMISGWVPRAPNVHLTFGILMHEGCEVYERAKFSGADHQQALRVAVRHVMAATWNKETGKPWWSDHKDKNRFTLVRTLVWYLDDFGQKDTLQTITLANGQPAIELSFKFVPVDFETGNELMSESTGEPIYFSGHLDRMVRLNETLYICDRKTTSSTLGYNYFAQYSPDNQFSMYTYAGRFAFLQPVEGVICDAAQVKVTFSKFERQLIPRTEPQIREWFADTKFWLQLMGRMAEANRWPQNDKSCGIYGGCPYRPLCSRTPAARQQWLEADYMKSTWDPAIARTA